MTASTRRQRSARILVAARVPAATVAAAAVRFAYLGNVHKLFGHFADRFAAVVKLKSQEPVCRFATILLLGWWRHGLRHVVRMTLGAAASHTAAYSHSRRRPNLQDKEKQCGNPLRISPGGELQDTCKADARLLQG